VQLLHLQRANLLIHYKNQDGFEKWIEYNQNGDKIHYKESTEFEEWYDYDDKGRQIHFKDTLGKEIWSKYEEYNCEEDANLLFVINFS